ncbi:hypothetical protein GCK72_012131 [Caenorhabditis remanei]|uniref:Uncharacterized protein n=1 Tax=Caenorhabditis remanei TaxID=31234 RepID=A0A6A5GM15_CAERE|nr:hypothetical protein GCK72_012131 [Caenorhabditis remanei]KAF1755681.1 hypothetical protein GCK72_012131 [Caenorhabditis remanei]
MPKVVGVKNYSKRSLYSNIRDGVSTVPSNELLDSIYKSNAILIFQSRNGLSFGHTRSTQLKSYNKMNTIKRPMRSFNAIFGKRLKQNRVLPKIHATRSCTKLRDEEFEARVQTLLDEQFTNVRVAPSQVGTGEGL